MKKPTFSQTSSAVAMICTVRVNIRADADVVWNLLTDARGFSRWNSTVLHVEGEIEEGARLRLYVPDSERAFTPKVAGMLAPRRMVWSDGVPLVFRGVRTFSLERQGNGSTNFTMEERFSGLFFALVRTKMPDFRPIFETYADDLRREAEQLSAIRRWGLRSHQENNARSAIAY